MARRRRAEKREVIPDSRYGSKTVTLLVNLTMRQGKKSVAEKIIYGAFDKLAAEKQGSDPLEILERAVSNARPRLEVKSRRVGGATYQIPLEITTSRQTALALRWMVSFSRMPWPLKSGTPVKVRVVASARGTRCTKWPRPTRPSRTSAGREEEFAWPGCPHPTVYTWMRRSLK